MASHPIADLEAEALWNAAVDGMVLVDETGAITATNPSLDAMFGYPAAELVGRPVEELIPREQRSNHLRYRSQFAEAPEARPMAARNLEGLRSDGSTFPVNVSLAPIQTDAGLVTFAAVRDLSARVLHEQQLAEANRRRAIAEDHDRIAKELHDSVIQRLFALGLGLQGLPAMIDDPQVAQRISSGVDTIDEIIRDIRSTIHDLHTPQDVPVALRPLVVSVASEAEPNLGFVPDLAFHGALEKVTDQLLVSDAAAVVREALSNVGRHAQATRAEVTVSVNDRLAVTVMDNGVGIDPSNGRSSGLSNMAQRATARGGTCTVTGRMAGGTLVKWDVPVDPAD